MKTQLQQLMHINHYAKWIPEESRRETWYETCERVIEWFKGHTLDVFGLNVYEQLPWQQLHTALLKMEVMPSMRVLQMAGPALDRDHLVAYNCAALPLKDWKAFAELFYILMGGTGCGFSVEKRFVEQLPKIELQNSELTPIYHEVHDSTEGWCNALWDCLLSTSEGLDITFDYSKCRPAGSVLKTKGGRSSGPEPLRQLLEFTKAKLLSRQGEKLSPLDCHDIACMCGSIVQVGGVRRAAEISLSDLSDTEMRDCKRGAFWDTAVFRAMANNSAVYETKPSPTVFLEEWLSLVKSGTGERGIFNRGQINNQIPARRTKRDDWLTNPCAEIYLRPYGLCNLSIAVARPNDTFDTLQDKVRLATVWGTLQSTLTNFQYVRPEWKANAEEERLLGVDITGQWDCPLFADAFSRWDILGELRDTAILTNRAYAKILNINPSAAITCVKPSGNSSQLLDSSSGLHPRYAPFYIRRLRIGANAPVGKWLRDSGISWHPEVGQSVDDMSVMVVDFPCKAPDGARTRLDVDAMEMLKYWLDWKVYFTEHNPSATIYVSEDEWIEVGAWVYENWHDIGGLSFLPKDGGIYTLAPYEEITEQQYHELMEKMPQLDFEALRRYETSDNTELNRDYACLGGSCDL